MKILSWGEAKRAGLKRYFTGEPCKNGHLSERYVAKSACIECQSERLIAYGRKQRELRGSIPWSKSAEERRARRAASLRRYASTHPDRLIDSQRKFREARPGRVAEIKRSWDQRNPQSRKLRAHKRRARIVGAVSRDILARLMVLQRGKCAGCKTCIKCSAQLDHIVPLARNGAHEDKNLQLLCGQCNRRKSAKDPIAWAQEMGRLL